MPGFPLKFKLIIDLALRSAGPNLKSIAGVMPVCEMSKWSNFELCLINLQMFKITSYSLSVILFSSFFKSLKPKFS